MTILRRALTLFGWTKYSSILLGGFLLTIFLIVYVWWPLAEEVLSYIDWNGPWWLYMDWLLVGIFLFMSLTIISKAELKTDGLIVFVGIFGGLAIESWGTQTNLWHYYALPTFMRIADPYPYRPSRGCPDLPRWDRLGLLP